MRPCFDLHCLDGKVVECIGEDLVKTEEDCPTCKGTGEVEDGCYCHASCSCECLCGAWHGVECHCWD